MMWKPGERCKLVELRSGRVIYGKIDTVNGRKMTVQTNDGKLWSADVDSSFVQRPK